MIYIIMIGLQDILFNFSIYPSILISFYVYAFFYVLDINLYLVLFHEVNSLTLHTHNSFHD